MIFLSYEGHVACLSSHHHVIAATDAFVHCSVVYSLHYDWKQPEDDKNVNDVDRLTE